jgi:hypothetical protein
MQRFLPWYEEFRGRSRPARSQRAGSEKLARERSRPRCQLGFEHGRRLRSLRVAAKGNKLADVHLDLDRHIKQRRGS